MTTGHRTLDLDDPEVVEAFIASLKREIGVALKEELAPFIKRLDTEIDRRIAKRLAEASVR